MAIKGSGFDGSEDIQISVANQELVPTTPSTWHNVVKSFYKFSFINKQDCHIIVNGKRLFCEADDGFESTEIDVEIHSFIIEEAGVEFNWRAAY